MPLMVSSDVLESLFGKFKTIVQRSTKAEINRLIFIMPLLCGKKTEKEISQAIKKCSHNKMLETIKASVPPTLRQMRRKLLIPSTEGVPNRGKERLRKVA